MSESSKTLYSYHTFVFPFLWNENGKRSLKTFKSCMSELWVPDYRRDTAFDERQYSQQCYFNQAARNAIFTECGDENPIVFNYRYDFGALCGTDGWLEAEKGADNPVEYHIVKSGFQAALKVNGVRLRLFTTGVGMLVFELENYQTGDEQFVLEVNEYGRRVYSPYIGGGGCGLCADCLKIVHPAGEFGGRVAGVHNEHCGDVCLSGMVVKLLSHNGYSVTAAPARREKELHIEPIIDDRMFTACYYINKAFTDEMMQWDAENGRYQYLTEALEKRPYEPTLANRLYKMVFVDADGISCHNRRMLHDLLDTHLYTRWLECYSKNGDEYCPEGSLIGISEYSIVQVASGDFPAVTAFLPMYTEMAMLVLAQRASLLSFERQISDSSRGKIDINRMQREYVLFESRLLLREVTPQQQGIELYDMLLDNLFIDKEKDELEGQISALFAEQTGLSESRENFILLVLAVVGLAEVLMTMLDLSQVWWAKLISLSVCGLVWGAYRLFGRSRLK